MGELALNLTKVSYETYLEVEENSEEKFEYHDGLILAMAGGTPAHSQLIGNTAWAVNSALINQDKPCIFHSSELRLRIEEKNRSFYADGSVFYDEPQSSPVDKNALINPILVFEVLSEGTAKFDRGDKFHHYQQIPSLQEYVLVSQTVPMVETYFRQEEKGGWFYKKFQGLEEMVRFESIGCEVAMADLYRLVPDLQELD